MENFFIQPDGNINVTIQPTKEKLKGVMPTAGNVITSFYFFLTSEYNGVFVLQVQVQEAQVQLHTANTQGQADPYISLRQQSILTRTRLSWREGFYIP